MTSLLRYERKFLLSPGTYWNIITFLNIGFRRDRFSSLAPGEKYLVRSLYFDSRDFRDYVEKVNGVNQRKKMRLRTYWSERGSSEFVSVEHKYRFGDLIKKVSERVSMAQYDRFMEQGSWGDDASPVLQTFEALVRLDMLEPKSLVEYKREVYESCDDQSVRISFDHDIRYAMATALFPDAPDFRFDLSCYIILEIKAHDDSSLWIQELVHRFGLKSEPNSKYVNSIDHTSQLIWY